jgi:4-amino-4-deoxy-L-arabinose transferase-like glycosyltransferase
MEHDEGGASITVSAAPRDDHESDARRRASPRAARFRVDALLIVAIIVAAVLRFWRLAGEPLWYDEYVTAQNVAAPLGRVFSISRAVEGTPPLFVYLEWFWTRVFGRGDVALRSLPAVAGVASVGVVYAFVRELGRSRRIAGIAALLVATNPMLVWYSREARAYSLLVLIGTISLWCTARAVRRGRTRDFVTWGVVAALALCTHYYAIVLLVPEVAWLAWARRGEWKKLAIGCALPAMAAIPLAWLAHSQEGERQAWIKHYAWTMRVGEAARQAASGPGKALDLTWLGLAALGVAAFVVVARGSHDERRTAGVMTALAATGVGIGAIAGVNYFLGRNVIVQLIPLLVVVAIGFGTRRAGIAGGLAVLVLCGLWTAAVVRQASDERFQKPDWRNVAAHFSEGGDDRAIVVSNYLGAAARRYLPDDGTFDQLEGDETVDVQTIDLAYHVAPPTLRCGRFSGLQCEVFWFPSFPEALASDFALVDKIAFDGYIVNRYKSPEPVRVDRSTLLGDERDVGAFVLVRR